MKHYLTRAKQLFRAEHWVMVSVIFFTLFVINQQFKLHTLKEALIFATFDTQGALGRFFLPIFFGVGFYSWLYISKFLVDNGITKKSAVELSKKFFKSTLQFIWDFSPLIITSGFLFFINGLIAKLVFSKGIALQDNLLANVDYRLFGTYPFLQLPQYLSFLGKTGEFIITNSYTLMSTFVSLGAIYLYYKNKTLFRQFILSFLLVTIAALPFYYFVPAVGPYEAYISGYFEHNPPQNIAAALHEYKPSENIDNFFQTIQNMRPDGYIVTSSLPSMHVAWALLLVWFVAKENKKLLYLLVPWLFFMLIGTIYLAQHYFIDLPAAVPFVVVSIWASSIIVKD